MSVWFKPIFPSLLVFGLLAAAPVFIGSPAQAQNGPGGGAAVFEACPDPASDPVDVPTPCLAIVSFDPALSRDERAVIARGAGAAVRFNFTLVGAAAVLIPNEAAYWALADDSDVTAFTPDRRVDAFGGDCADANGHGPHVGGIVVALVKEACAALTQDQVRDIIEDNADGIGSLPLDSPTNGYSFDGTLEGIVDAYFAVSNAACP